MRTTTPYPEELPIFSLGNPLFPAGLLHLNIFEPRYLAMTAACIGSGKPFGVSLIRAGFEVGVPAIPSAIGCTARIIEWSQPMTDRYRLVAKGETLFRIINRRVADDGLMLAQVELIDPPDPLPLPPQHAALAALIKELIAALGEDAPLPKPRRFDDAAWVANRWAELLPVTPERRQRWLEQADPLTALVEIEKVLAEQTGQPP
ncbi:MAG: LON peptidase substrate-binding domain-containing protein [Stagnimonas sp.]|nr:LON peptidase substrate-binding domain-containing protein [Stagnimonas sp.]